MSQKRRQYTGAYKFKVALAAAKGDKTVGQLSSETGVHSSQIGNWKRRLIEQGPGIFEVNGSSPGQADAKQEAELYEQIGRLQMELAWLKKKVAVFD